MKTIRQFWCGIWGGHTDIPQTTPTRRWLLCTTCDRETPGWELSTTAPKIKIAGDPRRHVLRDFKPVRKAV